jgi:hypothetical protein
VLCAQKQQKMSWGHSVFELWPATSSDLHQLHFYLWGHHKSTVYAVAINDAMELKQGTEGRCKLIYNMLRIFERVQQSLMGCTAHSVEAQGQTSEHFKCSSHSSMSEEYCVGPSMSVCLSVFFCNNGPGVPLFQPITVQQWDLGVPILMHHWDLGLHKCKNDLRLLLEGTNVQ